MREISASEARKNLGQLLDRVVAGEKIAITRRGRAVAWLVPFRPVVDAESVDAKSAQDAAAAIRAMSKGVRLRGLSLKNLIAEGRR
jgi:prevent-host-death family protein